MVERMLVLQYVLGSIPHGGHIELVHVPASAIQLKQQMLWCVLSCVCEMVHINEA